MQLMSNLYDFIFNPWEQLVSIRISSPAFLSDNFIESRGAFIVNRTFLRSDFQSGSPNFIKTKSNQTCGSDSVRIRINNSNRNSKT